MTDMVMENLHRHLYGFMIVDLLLGIFIVSPLLILLPYYLSLILVIPIFGVITFKNKREYGDLVGISLLLILSLIFALVGIQDLSRGDNSDTIQGILLLLLSISTIRRIKTIRNPTYKNWYNNMKENIDVLNSQLEENEVFATCPSCSTLLAVIPSKLSEEDKCPNCNGNLVN